MHVSTGEWEDRGAPLKLSRAKCYSKPHHGLTGATGGKEMLSQVPLI